MRFIYSNRALAHDTSTIHVCRFQCHFSVHGVPKVQSLVAISIGKFKASFIRISCIVKIGYSVQGLVAIE